MTRPYKRAPAAAVLVFARAPTSLARVGSAKSKQPYAGALRVEIAVHPSVGHSAMSEGCARRVCSECDRSAAHVQLGLERKPISKKRRRCAGDKTHLSSTTVRQPIFHAVECRSACAVQLRLQRVRSTLTDPVYNMSTSLGHIPHTGSRRFIGG